MCDDVNQEVLTPNKLLLLQMPKLKPRRICRNERNILKPYSIIGGTGGKAITELREYHKCTTKKRNISPEVGDAVLIEDKR